MAEGIDTLPAHRGVDAIVESIKASLRARKLLTRLAKRFLAA